MNLITNIAITCGLMLICPAANAQYISGFSSITLMNGTSQIVSVEMNMINNNLSNGVTVTPVLKYPELGLSTNLQSIESIKLEVINTLTNTQPISSPLNPNNINPINSNNPTITNALVELLNNDNDSGLE
jgi:hypothetical protein